ncbi:MAG TPA: hypothetical protein VFQ51_18670 [Vicinamibacteria bacterium]|nr:hypothetical protein [Vicinamibacteria bacterium]
MRTLAAMAFVLGFALPAAAQQKGSFALDAMTTPGRHFGAGYYITDGLSLRPSLGFGWSQGYGSIFNLGADVRYEFLTAKRLSPYLAGSYNYMRSPYLTDSIGAVVANESSNVSRWGGGGGLRARINDRFSVFADGRVMNSQVSTGPGTALGPQQVVDYGAHFEGALGLTFFLN